MLLKITRLIDLVKRVLEKAVTTSARIGSTEGSR